MKLSEKTLELNICAQLTAAARPRHRLFWFGLTQRQEARAGFDACTRFRGRLLVFQFKASRHVLKNGSRKFLAPHRQMEALKRRTGAAVRSVFYAFPLVGTTQELRRQPNLLDCTWLLDVSALPLMAPPTTTGGTPRKNRCHNVYVWPGKALICSDPFEAQVLSLRDFASEGFVGADGFQWAFEENFDAFWEFCGFLRSGARGLVVY